ncbi:aminodeoxychorismate synthase component I [Sedimentitalea sp. XS_ASV28]|uniref:aminodeoxychorismate synthase component I n=1 Tax=Sedimentitalea sp. XS_ASV28 TaxID=3241296 RepID=UPI00351368E7
MDIRFDQGPQGPGDWFRDPVRLIRADRPGEVDAALSDLDAAQAQGHWLAGYCSYELGYALEPRLAALMPRDRRLPLLAIGVYGAPGQGALKRGPAGFDTFRPSWDRERYRQAFDRVHALIRAGDIYQANLTFPMRAVAHGGAQELYAALMERQPVGYGALVEQDGLPDLLCRSPELFFRTDADGLIETLPMKGTQPRGGDAEDDARRRAFLANDVKNRAENLMIVDLLRNDLSRVSRPGSVQVPRLFHVQTYRTVHQMVSQVQARMQPGLGASAVLRALFPCGSITGAPKIRAMEVIRDLETAPRDIYCGGIGWIAPDGRSSFNVAIRTILLEKGQARLNVGGGVVYDSDADSEYEEALWKARFSAISQPIRV